MAFSAFFSGIEIAYVSASKFRHELDKNGNTIITRILDIFYNNPNQFISTMLVGNNIALVIYGLQMAELLEPFFLTYTDNYALVVIMQTIGSTILILFAGEFVPKTVFRISPNFSLKIFALPLFIIYIVLFPISKLASILSNLILLLTGNKLFADQKVSSLTKVDLDYFLQQRLEEAPEDSEIETEVKMFQNALEFSNVRLRDCIVPRNEIVACEYGNSLQELKNKFIETGLSKVLIYKDNIDNIIGYIHSSELFFNPKDWTTRIREVLLVPETMAANKLMRQLMQEKKGVAIVVDEFGGISGMLTLEDLVEEIFGDIEDEHDVKTYVARKISEKEYLLSGRVEIDSLNEKFDLDLPESDEFVTVAGYILHHYQNFPKVNETIVIDKYSFKIIRMTSTKIDLVRMKIAD